MIKIYQFEYYENCWDMNYYYSAVFSKDGEYEMTNIFPWKFKWNQDTLYTRIDVTIELLNWLVSFYVFVMKDLVQGATAFSQVSTCPLLTPHQVHLAKHQGITMISH